MSFCPESPCFLDILRQGHERGAAFSKHHIVLTGLEMATIFLTITTTNIFSVDIQYIHISRWTWAAPAFWSCLFLYFFQGSMAPFGKPLTIPMRNLQQLFLRYFSLLPCNLPCNYDLCSWLEITLFQQETRKYIMHSGWLVDKNGNGD